VTSGRAGNTCWPTKGKASSIKPVVGLASDPEYGIMRLGGVENLLGDGEREMSPNVFRYRALSSVLPIFYRS
jgi:hypothetical protein